MRRRPDSNNQMKEKAKKLVSAALKSAVGYSIYKAAYQLEQQAIDKAKNKVKDATLYTIYISKNNIANGMLIGMLRKETPKYHTIIDGEFEDATAGVGTVPRAVGLYVKFYNKTPIFINLNDAVPFGNSGYVPTLPLINPEYSYDDDTPAARPRFNYRRAFSSHPQPTPTPVYTNNTAFITITTLNNKKMIHDMKCWLKKLIKESEEERREMIESSKTLDLTSNRDDVTRSMKKRSMETVFIDEKIKKDIMDSLDAFVCNRDWYDDNFIPYHYGILLHGPAGTGKSTLIRAIITEYYKKCAKSGYTIEPPSYLSTPSDLLHLDESGYSEIWAPRIIIIEDIDATVLKKRVPEEEEEKALEDPSNAYTQQYHLNKQSMYYPDLTSLSEILNKMDGVANVENVIYIFTTNHIENLDPALTRPGRIDKIVEIKMPRREDYDAFIFYHFKKHIPDNIVIRTSKLIAELQTDIVCKKTYDEMIEILQKED
jgi:AAA+ superfamily predicted ATPase